MFSTKPYGRWFEIACFVIAYFAIQIQVWLLQERAPVADELVYIKIAHDLAETGIFTNGGFGAALTTDLSPGRFFAPLYPGFLAGMMSLFESVNTFVTCHATAANECPSVPWILQIMQATLAAISISAIAIAARIITSSGLVAATSLAIMIFTGLPAYYATTTLSENTAFFGFYLFLAAGAIAIVKGSSRYAAMAGLALGVAILSRPSYLYLFYVLVFAAFSAAVLWRQVLSWRVASAFTATVFLVISIWAIRNTVQFGTPALAEGYGGYILAYRVSYNAMTWTEWWAFLVYGLPDFGDKLAPWLFGSEAIERLRYESPTGFFVLGGTVVDPQTVAASGGREFQLSYLLREHVLGDIVTHLIVTIPLTLRGIWAGKYLGLVALFCLIPALLLAHRYKRLAPYLFLIGAPLFMAGLHGFTSVNVVRYNVPMIAPFALTVAWVIVENTKAWRHRKTAIAS